jgi:hypothetical protein
VRNYKKEIILTADDLSVLREVWRGNSPKRIFRTDNLHYTKRFDIHSAGQQTDSIDENLREPFQLVLKKISSCSVYNIASVFFVEYQQESYASIHRDWHGSLTTVTLVDATDDLEGGEAIIQLNSKRSIKSFRDCPSYIQGKLCQPSRKIKPLIETHIVPLQVGETLMYGPMLLHGVSKVLSGRRLVLVVWFDRK